MEERIIGQLLEATKNNTESIRKNAEQINWLKNTIIYIAVMFVIAVVVQPLVIRALEYSKPKVETKKEKMMNVKKNDVQKTYTL